MSNHEIKKLMDYILDEGYNLIHTSNEYELFRINENNVNIIVYTSGKIVYKGNGAKKVISKILAKEKDYDYIIGSDETGKGEWFGPLVIVATALTPDEILDLRKLGVRDSKTIKKSQIMKLAETIMHKDFVRHSLILRPQKYNELYNNFKNEKKNLNDMMAWAHSVVIQETLKQIEFKKAKVVIDKFDFEKTEYRLEKIDKTNLEIIQKTGGESEIPVAAASIIAKYLFEKEVDKLNNKFKIDLRKYNPSDIDQEILPRVAKVHFKNVKQC